MDISKYIKVDFKSMTRDRFNQSAFNWPFKEIFQFKTSPSKFILKLMYTPERCEACGGEPGDEEDYELNLSDEIYLSAGEDSSERSAELTTSINEFRTTPTEFQSIPVIKFCK